MSIHLSKGFVIAFPVPAWFLNLEIVLPTPPMMPVNPAPSNPNFNLFNISVVGSSVSLSNSVGPPSKSPKVPASSTSATNTPSANPPKPAPTPNAPVFSKPVAPFEKASLNNLFSALSNLPPFNFFETALDISPPKSKYLPLLFAIKAPLAKPLPTLKAIPPGTPMLVINSVIFPAVVASANSSKGFIFAKNSSTSAALFVSPPKSINVAPSDTKPSGILKRPEPIPASADTNAFGLLFSSASVVVLFVFSFKSSPKVAIAYLLYLKIFSFSCRITNYFVYFSRSIWQYYNRKPFTYF